MKTDLGSSTFCDRCKTVDGCVCQSEPKRPRRKGTSLAYAARRGAELYRQESLEAERQACIAILEDLRPRNDSSDWTEFAWARDSVLVQAINHINRRSPV